MAELSHEKRFGRFTSSQIGRLCNFSTREMTEDEKANHKKLYPKSKKTKIEDENSFSAIGLSYIEEKVYESRTQRRIQNETTSKPTSYGKLAEMLAFQQLTIEYVLTSELTIECEKIENVSGSPDGYKILNNEIISVFDIKCPITLLSYCRLADLCISNDVQKFKEDEPIYYWQLVNNSRLLKCKTAELIIFMPYKEQLQELKVIIEKKGKSESGNEYEYYWIEAALNSGNYENLPYLLPNTYYKNLYKLTFDVPQSEVDFLTKRVLLANEFKKDLKGVLSDKDILADAVRRANVEIDKILGVPEIKKS